MHFRSNLSEPKVKVLGGPDLFINAGSFINLTCSGYDLPGTPEDVFWYHEKQVLTEKDKKRRCHDFHSFNLRNLA